MSETWSTLGQRMRYTDTPAKCAAILAGLPRLTWLGADHADDCLRRSPVREVAAAALARHGHPQRIARTAITLHDGTQAELIGIEDAGGSRHYLLQLGHGEALYVLLIPAAGHRASQRTAA